MHDNFPDWGATKDCFNLKAPTKVEKLKRFEGVTPERIVSDLLDYVDQDLREVYRRAIYDLAHNVVWDCDKCEEKWCDIDWENL